MERIKNKGGLIMKDQEKIRVTKSDGTVAEADVLLYFTLKENGKDYVIYTLNERDEHGLITVYTSTIVKNNDEYHLEGIESDEEWAKIKDVMRTVIKENKE